MGNQPDVPNTRKFSISAQVRMCGNSVDPAMASAFLIANAPWLAVRRAA